MQTRRAIENHQIEFILHRIGMQEITEQITNVARRRLRQLPGLSPVLLPGEPVVGGVRYQEAALTPNVAVHVGYEF